MMKVGYACQEITPDIGGTLCGFVSRCHRSSTEVDDPLWLRALAVEQDEVLVLLLVFDLLGLGPEITRRIETEIDQVAAGIGLPVHHQLLCTHTHSAPAAIKLLGCGLQDPAFENRLASDAAAVAKCALVGRRLGTLRFSTVSLPHGNINRRRFQSDGKVVMNSSSVSTGVPAGPTWDEAILARFDDEEGRGIAGFLHWAAHPVTVCSQGISSDFPGELCRRLDQKFDMPFLYLQGACGNLNPPFENMTREEMLRNVDRLMPALENCGWEEGPVSTIPFAWRDLSLNVRYGSMPGKEQLEAFREEMWRVFETGNGDSELMTEVLNILNRKAGNDIPPEPLRHLALTLAGWSQECLESNQTATCKLAAALWRCGPLAFCFAGIEPFVETALALKEAASDVQVVLVGYSSPLLGYLPPDRALQEGGYEVTQAYRFYGHPAAFAVGSELQLREAFLEAIAGTRRLPQRVESLRR